jgi:heme-degrading monooxygenase HmoA
MTAITIGLVILSCGKKTEEPPVLETKSASNADRGRLEVNITFNIPKGTAKQAYQLWMNDVLTKIRNTEGCISCFVSNNIADYPEVKITIWWQSLASWAEFTTSSSWYNIRAHMNSVYATEINAEYWILHMVLKTKQTEEPPEPDTKTARTSRLIEVNFTMNLAPGVSEEQFENWVSDALNATGAASGNMLSFSSLNIWDSPQVQWTTWWRNLTNWTEFAESRKWQGLLNHLYSRYASEITIEIWELETELKTMQPGMISKKKKPEEPPEPDTL